VCDVIKRSKLSDVIKQNELYDVIEWNMLYDIIEGNELCDVIKRNESCVTSLNGKKLRDLSGRCNFCRHHVEDWHFIKA